MKWAWLDKKIVKTSKELIVGFDGGRGLFETMRCYQGQVFALNQHLARLIKGCLLLGIDPPAQKKLKKAVTSMVKANRLKNGSLRLNLFKQKKGLRLFVVARPFFVPTNARYRKCFSVVLLPNERIVASPLRCVKSLDRRFFDRLLGLAKEKGFDEAIFLNSFGQIVEGTRTNIFLVRNNKVITPALSCGCLPGVTRAIVMKLFKRAGIPVVESRILPKELFCQDEIFVTNSLLEVMPVTRLDNKPVGKGRAGSITKKILRAYQKEVVKECFLG